MRASRLRVARAALLLPAGLLVAACASTSLVNQWKSPEYTGAPLRKVLVLGVSEQPSVRRVFEDEFASRLTAAGVNAVREPTDTSPPSSAISFSSRRP